MESVRLYIFMEECSPQPTLYDLVRVNEPIKPDAIRNYTKAIVIGIRELQKVGVAHRNLKLQHIIFDKTGHPKLCGWSKSVLYYDPRRNRILLQQKERRVRRNYFLPPEAFRRSYDASKADIWSIGVLLVAMCTKRYPFNVRDIKTKFSTQWRQFVKKIQMNTFVRNLCNKIFIIDPKSRISPSKILEDSYFKVALSKLIPLSIRADPDMMEHESLRVGAVSATDVDSPPQPKTEEEKEAIKEDLAADQKQAQEEKNEEVEGEPDEDQPAKTDDGGSVGDEENLPEEEAQAESQIAEKNAPEETEDAANPDDGGAADAETQQEYEG